MKGLCPDCAVEVGQALACKNACEENVKKINEAQNNTPALQGYGKAMRFAGPLFLIVYGAYLLVNWSGLLLNQKDIGLTGLGGISVAFGLWIVVKSFSNSGSNNA
jgi:hypothetical protein